MVPLNIDTYSQDLPQAAHVSVCCTTIMSWLLYFSSLFMRMAQEEMSVILLICLTLFKSFNLRYCH